MEGNLTAMKNRAAQLICTSFQSATLARLSQLAFINILMFSKPKSLSAKMEKSPNYSIMAWIQLERIKISKKLLTVGIHQSMIRFKNAQQPLLIVS